MNFGQSFDFGVDPFTSLNPDLDDLSGKYCFCLLTSVGGSSMVSVP